ncbi:MAG: hypothetical protein U9O94_03790 [Nanoarchaeota archaeon]|nr:hypothetical protein [Nanoarchaeota archaeon]
MSEVNTEDTGKKLPEKKISTGAISATIWKNDGKNKKTGEAVEFRTITLQRRYTDKDGNWQTSSSLRLNDLPKASLVLQKAYEYLVLKGQDTPQIESNSKKIEEEIVM